MAESVDPLEERIFDTTKDNVAGPEGGDRLVAVNVGLSVASIPTIEQSEVLAAPEMAPEKPYSFWEERWKLAVMFGKVYILIMVAFLGILSIYWGSLYRREDRIRNMGMLVVIDDDQIQLTNSSTAPPLLGEAFRVLISESGDYGHFTFMNSLDLNNSTAEFDEIAHLIHEEKYWAGFYVNQTASQIVYDLLVSGNSLSLFAYQLQYIVTAVYESGRQFSALSQYVTRNLRSMETSWLSNIVPEVYASMVETYLNDLQRQFLIQSSNSTNTSSVLSVLPPFNMVDRRPSRSAAVLGPSELGLIYAQLFSFHQFNFSVELYNSIMAKLQFRDYVMYRIMFSQVNHAVLGLVYALLTIAFQVPIDPAYGGPGFLILWITMYLFSSASGGINECIVSWILFKDYKALLAPFMIFYIVINIAPTFAPFVLSPGFYRYGYAMPMVNAYEALKVLFFNTWKGSLGRNYGILGAWIVATNIALVGILKWISDSSNKQAKKELSEKNDSENNESEKGHGHTSDSS